MANEVTNEILLRLAVNSDRIIEALTKAGVAYVGYSSNNHWTGALTALVALKLAQGGNLAAGVTGTGVLALMGLDRIRPKVPDVRSYAAQYPK